MATTSKDPHPGSETRATPYCQGMLEDRHEDYYDIMVIGRKGSGKSTTADKLLIANPGGLPQLEVPFEEPEVNATTDFTQCADMCIWHA